MIIKEMQYDLKHLPKEYIVLRFEECEYESEGLLDVGNKYITLHVRKGGIYDYKLLKSVVKPLKTLIVEKEIKLLAFEHIKNEKEFKKVVKMLEVGLKDVECKVVVCK